MINVAILGKLLIKIDIATAQLEVVHGELKLSAGISIRNIKYDFILLTFYFLVLRKDHAVLQIPVVLFLLVAQ